MSLLKIEVSVYFKYIQSNYRNSPLWKYNENNLHQQWICDLFCLTNMFTCDYHTICRRHHIRLLNAYCNKIKKKILKLSKVVQYKKLLKLIVSYFFNF